jgi:hypothetical protein
MTCPVCGQRKARRECPALRQTICSVCCGTKRLVEIACPEDCVHLTSARQHPAATVRRQQERDVAVLLPAIRHLSERQRQLFFLFHSVIDRHTPEGLSRLIDDDVADAAGATAATLETADRGVIYEHPTRSSVAERLARELKAVLAEVRERGTTVYDGEAAIALRAIEKGAVDVRVTSGGGDTAYLDLTRRLLQGTATASRPERERPQASGLIVVP